MRRSKGANHKEHPKAWEDVLVEYKTRSGVTIENSNKQPASRPLREMKESLV